MHKFTRSYQLSCRFTLLTHINHFSIAACNSTTPKLYMILHGYICIWKCHFKFSSVWNKLYHVRCRISKRQTYFIHNIWNTSKLTFCRNVQTLVLCARFWMGDICIIELDFPGLLIKKYSHFLMHPLKLRQTLRF